MSYRLKSRREEQRSPIKILLLLTVFGIVLAILFSGALSAFSRNLLSPLWAIKEALFQSDSLESALRSQKSIIAENEKLTDELANARLALLSYEELKKENEELKESLGGLAGREAIRTEVLVRPPISLYDTFVIKNQEGISVGNRVLVYGEVPVGEVVEANGDTALVRLYSAPGNTFQVSIGTETVELRGVGSGNFQVRLPKAVPVQKGEKIYFPGTRNLIGIVDEILSREADSFQTLFVISPINIFKVNSVEVIRQ